MRDYSPAHTLLVSRLRPGDAIIVQFGRSATQLAVVVEPGGGSLLFVRKWRQKSRTWTRTVRLPTDYVIRLANALEVRSRGLDSVEMTRGDVRRVAE